MAHSPIWNPFPPPCSTREDFADRDYREAEAAALSAVEFCAGCGRECPESPFRLSDAEAYCDACALALAADVVARGPVQVAGETRWGAQS